MDKRITGAADSVGWRYTRYADDLTVSTDRSPEKIGYMMARIRDIATEEGFEVNESKTRVLKQNTRQSVTGIVVNDRPSIDRKAIRRMRAILHRAKFEGLERQNRDNHPNFTAWVRGMIAYITMVNPDQGKRLKSDFDQLRRT